MHENHAAKHYLSRAHLIVLGEQPLLVYFVSFTNATNPASETRKLQVQFHTPIVDCAPETLATLQLRLQFASTPPHTITQHRKHLISEKSLAARPSKLLS
ncbi:hypothetical protein NP493_12g00000 [Ridgeia piscesae]|uniref:Uncharacterized protein n=1 Tax=Ridgeia piscesae TaxID=27915 RepID=A0AAD9UL69_RIDPI|nr:hypothetical protein NP493_12g00000 [Ridgeia piscesae]